MKKHSGTKYDKDEDKKSKSKKSAKKKEPKGKWDDVFESPKKQKTDKPVKKPK